MKIARHVRAHGTQSNEACLHVNVLKISPKDASLRLCAFRGKASHVHGRQAPSWRAALQLALLQMLSTSRLAFSRSVSISSEVMN